MRNKVNIFELNKKKKKQGINTEKKSSGLSKIKNSASLFGLRIWEDSGIIC
jgi:hypothetical protein